jgi:hypothetical protein
MLIQIKCDIHCKVKGGREYKTTRSFFIAAPSTAQLSHRKPASTRTFRGSCCVQDGDKRTEICKGIGKICKSGGGGGRLTRKEILYLVQEHGMCGYIALN